MSIEIATMLDIFLVTWSLWALLRWTDRSVFNPGYWYLLLHVLTVSSRLIMLAFGATSAPSIGVKSETEFVRCEIGADIALLAAVSASVFASARAGRLGLAASRKAKKIARLNPLVGDVISWSCIVFGVLSLIAFGAMAQDARARDATAAGADIGDLALTSYPMAVGGFAVLGAVMQCAIYGFTQVRTTMFLAILGLTAFNLTRVSFVLPLILALLVYLAMQGRRELSFQWTFALAGLAVLWFVFKPVGAAISSGEGIEKAWNAAGAYLDDTWTYGTGDLQYFDMQASFMAAADESGVRMYGATLLPLVYLPIPRYMWPDKPRLNQFMVGISSSARPFVQSGMTPTLCGEAYLNFGWFGCFFVPFIYLYAMSRAYLRVRNHTIASAGRWIYMASLVVFIQVFRDGLNSLVLFSVVHFLPLFAWGAISLMLPPLKLRPGSDRAILHHLPCPVPSRFSGERVGLQKIET